MSLRWAHLIALATTLFLSSVLSAREEGKSKAEIEFGPFTLSMPGEVRFVALRLSPLEVQVVDPERPDRIPLEESLSVRLRWRPSLKYSVGSKYLSLLGLFAEVDLLDGNAFAGPDRDILSYAREPRAEQDLFRADRIRLRGAYLMAHSPFFTFLGGRQKSHAGLGMVANDGEDRPDDLGVRRMGDIVDRALLAVRPAFSSDPLLRAVSVAFGIDHIERDLFADRSRNDRAYQALALLEWKPKLGKVGAFYLYRWQHNKVGDRTRIHLVDAFADLKFSVAETTLGVAGEWAGTFGWTEVPRSLVNPSSVDIRASAFVLRASLEHPWFKVEVDCGRASGDGNPYDNKYTAFTMNPDFRVGLILFPEVLSATSAVAAWNGAQRWFQGTPPRGLEALPTNGGVQNALYAFPKVTATFIPHIEIVAGVIVARSVVPLVDPFWLSTASSTATSSPCTTSSPPGPRCGPASKDLGYEVDAALRGRFQAGPFGLLAAIEYGYFRPGAAFNDQNGDPMDPIHMLQGRLHITF